MFPEALLLLRRRAVEFQESLILLPKIMSFLPGKEAVGGRPIACSNIASDAITKVLLASESNRNATILNATS